MIEKLEQLYQQARKDYENAPNVAARNKAHGGLHYLAQAIAIAKDASRE